MTGYGLVDRARAAAARGRLRLPRDGRPTCRCRSGCSLIHEALTELIETHRPDAVGVERLFFNKNVQTAFAVGQARGVVLLAAAQHGLPVYEYGPTR